ncbi:twin-arginine translocase subunit TatB [Actinoalloteichus sp. AHMU CJ021]|uniref:Sec-independent protein translocase protein TatB n=2 Tax=Pseudonocardiaceae TaxID=2070 RepID=UPI0004032A48|nr:Sec-independent protein translocase protein TatB [Actinoalloteichus caeruleus]AUS78228.1 twin-arginine translocase subunit TatB [Actinoalloteichus sp. AHMU CJ021]
MFENIGWPELFVLLLVGLFIFGPERLPAAAAWLGNTIRKVRDYASGAREQIRSEMGPEFDELRKPLEDLRGLRNLNPKTAITDQARKLFDDDRPLADGAPEKPNGHPTAGSGPARPPEPSLRPGERPPIDPDAT